MRKIIGLIITTLLIFNATVQVANAQMFGKNKKQYKIFNWKFIETKHFDIYFDDGSRVLADFAAVALEDALMSVQSTLNFRLTQRVSVIIYDSHNDFQQTNVINIHISLGIGGVTELFKNRVVVPFQGSYAQFRHVLHHELVHAVMNDMFFGGNFQTAVSTRGVMPIPLWVSEGFAEWESLGGMDAETDMFMRDLIFNESLPHLRALRGYLAYRCGQAFFHYVEQRYGRGKVTEFLNKLKIFGGLDATFRNTFGMDLDDFSEMWRTEMKRIYWPDINVFQSPREFATQLTNHERDNSFLNTSPAISPNGEHMAYISAKGGIFAIYVASTISARDRRNDRNARPRRLISSARQQDFEQLNVLTPGISWSPDSRRIAISAKSGGQDAIFLVNAANGKYERILINFSTITSVNWSPDGTKIAFVGVAGNRDGNAMHQSDIFYYDLETRTVVALTEDVFTDSYPVWSPDSKSVYFISDRGEHLSTNISASNSSFRIWQHDYSQSDVYKITLGETVLQRITNSPTVEKTCISVASDGNKMLVVANLNGISNIFEVSLNSNNNSSNNNSGSDATAMRPITNSANRIMQITVTPDGLNLLFSAQVRGGYDIFMLRNPYEIQLNIDTLTQTEFIRRTNQKRNLVDEIRNENSEETENIEPITYGNFEVSFANQQFLRPNQEVIELINISDSRGDFDVQSLFERPYEVSFSLDAFVANPAVSTFYGFQAATGALFSDVMGNHQIYISAYFLNNLNNSQLFATYLYAARPTNYSFSLYNSSIYTWQFLDDPDWGEKGLWGDYIYSYRATGAVLGASYPFSLFRRIELNLNLVNAAKNNVEIPNYESINRFLIVPEMRYVLDNTLNGIYAPTRGSRLFATARYSPKLGDLSSEFITLVTDARHYFEFIPHFMSFVVRGSAGISLGANPQNFYIGGVENWINASSRYGNFELKNPEDFAFMNSFVVPLRGWPIFMHSGDKFAIANFEYRFPIMMVFATGGIPLFIQGIMGNFFYDVGAAWSDDFRISRINERQLREPADLYMSAGWGIRAILFGLPFKFDMAWRNEYSGWSSPYYLFSLGLDF